MHPFTHKIKLNDPHKEESQKRDGYYHFDYSKMSQHMGDTESHSVIQVSPTGGQNTVTRDPEVNLQHIGPGSQVTGSLVQKVAHRVHYMML